MSKELQENDELTMAMDEVLVHEVTSRHSFFQLKHFVIGKEPTIQSKMWQCLREIKSRKESIEAIKFEIEDTKDNLELIDIDIQRLKNKTTKSVLTERKLVVHIRKLKRKDKAIRSSLVELYEKKKWMEEEARFFLEAFKNLRQVEDLKPFDDFDSQVDYWQSNLAKKINLRLLFQQPLDLEAIATALALPEGTPIKEELIHRMESIQKQVLELKKEHKQSKKSE